LQKKGFKEERVTKVGVDAIGTSTTLASNKSRTEMGTVKDRGVRLRSVLLVLRAE
jgi:hypothetical protein